MRKCSGIIAEVATVLFLLLNGLDIQLRHNTRQWVREVVAHPAYEPICRVLFAVALACILGFGLSEKKKIKKGHPNGCPFCVTG